MSDLQSIRDYTLETWGLEQERIYLDSLWSKFEAILSTPKKWKRRDDLFPGCQIAAQDKHVILFRVQGKMLQVIRILHSAMDFKRHISEDIE
ncbi:MAG TPA: type II toxin-antitoxin system RelE/ParE family toxin [Verrucomicrobiales bacterium]|nr:type II toxin-antitoxin system RelE/ParE family toxin [Verrucomicrobiales bacterium]HIL68536.1 type II toxin-antitoxin system RelE/ParE family toxin [Verrucomicrobiota bacterium]